MKLLTMFYPASLLLLTLLSLQILPKTTAEAHRLPFLSTSNNKAWRQADDRHKHDRGVLLSIRGGAETLSATDASSTTSSTRPPWINMDREKLQNYLALAREKHARAVRQAESHYWSGAKTHQDDETTDDSTTPSTPQALPLMDTYSIVPPATWKLPDFSEHLDSIIFVTHGHDANSTTTTTDDETPLFSKQECQQVIADAEAHFRNNSQQPSSSWTRLPSGQYDVAGFWIHAVPAVHGWFNHVVKTKLFPLLVQQFPEFVSSIDDLVVDNAYMFKYTCETGRRTGIHTDSGCLSFTIALNDPSDYSGGGTWFQGLKGGKDTGSTISMKQGHVTVRPGGVRHCGHAVESGVRYIIGGFCMHRDKVEYARQLNVIGQERVNRGDLQGAREALEAAISVNPHFDGGYSNLANVYEQLGQGDLAQKTLEHCLEHVNPQCGEVAYSLGVMYLDQKELDKAKKCAQTCLSMDDCDTDAMNILVQVCSMQGDKQGEEEWSRRIVETPGVSDKLAASTYCNLGILKEGQDEEIEWYERALQVDPSLFSAQYSLACAYAERKQLEQAIESFRLAIDVARQTSRPELQDTLKTLYRVVVGVAQAEAQRGELTTQEAMMERIQTLMGRENYAELAASARR
jgi:tetratricopeptide (TPR) repeat protein